MPRSKISEYSATANSNTDVAGVNVDEGCAPSGINNAIRAVMGHLKDFQTGAVGDAFNGPTVGAHNGTVGATTPAAGAFTTLSASSTVSGTGFSTYLASPPAIGGTAASAGAFTTLSASSTVSGTGFSTYLASPPAIGGTAAAAVSSTALSYTTTLTGGTGIVNLGSGQFYKDASGNVGIGTASPNSAGVGKALTINGATDSIIELNYGATRGGYLFANATNLVLSAVNSGILKFNTGDTERARIDSSGNFMVGTTSANSPNPGFGFAVGSNAQITIGHDTGSGNGQYYMPFKYNTNLIGGITQNGTTAVAYNTTSDYRLKENIAPLTGALMRVAALKPCTYTWKAAPDESGEGFIAHELAEVCPQATTGEKDAVDADGKPQYQGIDTSFLVATLTAAIQELKAIVDTQAAKIAALEAK